MADSTDERAIPASILVFGAAGRVGGPLARFLTRAAPEIRLRLVTTRQDSSDDLRRRFPNAEVARANYFDPPALESAVEGMEGIFVITTFGLDEQLAMTNLVAAVKRTGSAVHILRTLGLQPESNPRRIPPAVRDAGRALCIQHPIAKRILDESDLPVTYLNIGATFIDNLFWMKEPLVRERKLIWQDRLIPFIDPRDVAEIAGRVFLSGDRRHIGQFHTLNNGHDLIRFGQVADVMTEVFGEKITHDGDRESFLKAYSGRFGHERSLNIWNFLEYERENELVWARNDFAERMLGRKPVTLREWLEEHPDLLSP